MINMMLLYLKSRLKKLRQFNIQIQPGFSTKYCIYINKAKFSKIITSIYLTELIEKQKLKFTFLLKEKFIKKYIECMYKYRGFDLYCLLKFRFDSMLFILGIVITLSQARQLIFHGYFFVNFVKVKNPSFLIKRGDIISISNKSYFIFRLCKKNFYNKYLKITSIKSVNFYVCLKTFTFIILSLFGFKYNSFICYNFSLIRNQYC